MIKSFFKDGKRFSLVSSEEMNHYLDSDKIIFLLGDIFTDTSVRNNAENNMEEFIKMGFLVEPSDDRRNQVLCRIEVYRGYYDRVYSQDVKNFYCFVED